ncbi:MAG: hypothetical protein ACFFCZ_00325 [Promethearchaeota archaeon]
MKENFSGAILGVLLVGIIVLAGFILHPYIEELLFHTSSTNMPPDTPPDTPPDIRQYTRRYAIDLDYHNYSILELPITSLVVMYRQFNSSLLRHPDPYFAGIAISRECHVRDQYRYNDSMWRIFPYQGASYNEWNCSMRIGTSTDVNPALYAHHTYIAYEVVYFAQLILEAFSTAGTANETSLGYRLAPDEQNIPENYELTAKLNFENGSEIWLDAHKDGWVRNQTSTCVAWSITSDGIPYCQVADGEFPTYKDFGDTFQTFHQVFGEYARTHIHFIEEVP